jgi:hypothetical protein
MLATPAGSAGGLSNSPLANFFRRMLATARSRVALLMAPLSTAAFVYVTNIPPIF